MEVEPVRETRRGRLQKYQHTPRHTVHHGLIGGMSGGGPQRRRRCPGDSESMLARMTPATVQTKQRTRFTANAHSGSPYQLSSTGPEESVATLAPSLPFPRS